ncbi:MAG: hypothetical protein JOZ69_05035 [Myxococcales bacterium]|nr:hypothetical protein [Myxococcales bacterium]
MDRFRLYVILDVFSRYVVGWMIAHRERARASPRKLIEETCRRQVSQQLTPCMPTVGAR